jgi:hypothetical protein
MARALAAPRPPCPWPRRRCSRLVPTTTTTTTKTTTTTTTTRTMLRTTSQGSTGHTSQRANGRTGERANGRTSEQSRSTRALPQPSRLNCQHSAHRAAWTGIMIHNEARASPRARAGGSGGRRGAAPGLLPPRARAAARVHWPRGACPTGAPRRPGSRLAGPGPLWWPVGGDGAAVLTHFPPPDGRVALACVRSRVCALVCTLSCVRSRVCEAPSALCALPGLCQWLREARARARTRARTHWESERGRERERNRDRDRGTRPQRRTWPRLAEARDRPRGYVRASRGYSTTSPSS